jgi:tRNA threonylcarbamoyladenosine biosynthesis protein TsaE
MSSAFTEQELEDLGRRLAAELPPRSVIWLQGDLAAGKTTLVRALVRARGASVPATSPTFNLVHRYEGPRGAMFHVDCYRLRSPAEAAELDWSELEQGDLLLVEWPERAGTWAAPPCLRIRLDHVPDPDRRAVHLHWNVSEAQ